MSLHYHARPIHASGMSVLLRSHARTLPVPIRTCSGRHMKGSDEVWIRRICSRPSFPLVICGKANMSMVPFSPLALLYIVQENKLG